MSRWRGGWLTRGVRPVPINSPAAREPAIEPTPSTRARHLGRHALLQARPGRRLRVPRGRESDAGDDRAGLRRPGARLAIPDRRGPSRPPQGRRRRGQGDGMAGVQLHDPAQGRRHPAPGPAQPGGRGHRRGQLRHPSRWGAGRRQHRRQGVPPVGRRRPPDRGAASRPARRGRCGEGDRGRAGPGRRGHITVVNRDEGRGLGLVEAIRKAAASRRRSCDGWGISRSPRARSSS